MAVEHEVDAPAVRLRLERRVSHVPGVGLDATPMTHDVDGEDHVLDVEQPGERSDLLRIGRVDRFTAQPVRDVRESQVEVGARAGDEERQRGGVRTARTCEDRTATGVEPMEMVRDPGDDAREIDARRERAERMGLGVGGQRRTGALLRPGRSTARQ